MRRPPCGRIALAFFVAMAGCSGSSPGAATNTGDFANQESDARVAAARARATRILTSPETIAGIRFSVGTAMVDGPYGGYATAPVPIRVDAGIDAAGAFWVAANSTVRFDPQGRLMGTVRLDRPARLAGIDCGSGDLSFLNGAAEECVLAHDQTINGIPCTTFANRHMGNLQCKLGRTLRRYGISFPAGAIYERYAPDHETVDLHGDVPAAIRIFGKPLNPTASFDERRGVLTIDLHYLPHAWHYGPCVLDSVRRELDGTRSGVGYTADHRQFCRTALPPEAITGI